MEFAEHSVGREGPHSVEEIENLLHKTLENLKRYILGEEQTQTESPQTPSAPPP